MEKITEDQLRRIKEFSCERLSCNPLNRDLIETFVSERGKGLVNYLKHFAWEEDIQGTTANYLIKSSGGKLLCSFLSNVVLFLTHWMRKAL